MAGGASLSRSAHSAHRSKLRVVGVVRPPVPMLGPGYRRLHELLCRQAPLGPVRPRWGPLRPVGGVVNSGKELLPSIDCHRGTAYPEYNDCADGEPLQSPAFISDPVLLQIRPR